MRRALVLACIGALAAACSSLPDAGSGVVALEIRTPDTLGGSGCTSTTSCSVTPGDSLVFHARALNLQGDSVAATILWSTPDTALISLDAARGVVVALSDTGGTARVQASVGSLRSNVITILLVRPSTPGPGLRGPP